MFLSRFVPAALAASLLSCAPAERVQTPSSYQIGDQAAAGHLVYTVFEKQWHTEFGSGPDARVPHNRFYLVRIKVVNRGQGEALIPPTELVDDSGASFPEVNDGEGVQNWIGDTRQLRPSETAQGYVLFDVQPKRYKLRVSAEEGKETALVDLPLTFDSDLPEVTTPLDPTAIPPKK